MDANVKKRRGPMPQKARTKKDQLIEELQAKVKA